MPKVAQVRKQLAKFFAGKLSLPDFEEWLTRETWNIQRLKDSTVWDLAGAIELRLAEYSNGHLDEKELRTLLMRVAANQKLESSNANVWRSAANVPVKRHRVVAAPAE